MKKLLLIFILTKSIGLYSQIPEDINNLHQKLCKLNGKKSHLLTRDEKNKTQEMAKKAETFYDSITEYYKYYNSKKKLLKGVRFYFDNDIFAVLDNRDHEYTGGFRIELITDFFGTKFLSWHKDHEYLNYQSILFGFELYTPNVLNVKSVNDLDKRDRPFASFQYIGRSRNIIRHDGKYRVSGVLKLGIIGGNVSREFQRIIHRDITDSENNNGWDYQLANGGRIAIQYDYSNEWQYKFNNKKSYLNFGFKAKAGFEKFSLTPTLGFTNKSFFEKNPHYAINTSNEHFGTQNLGKQISQTWFYEVKLEPEIVFYNSMLQGYITKNEEFVFNDVTKTNQKIPTISNINRVVGRFSLGTGFRNYNSTLLFEYYIQTPEYDYSWKNKYFHKYARISFTMNI